RPPHRIRRPRGHVLVMQQHHVEVIGVRQLAQLIDLFLRIYPFARRHLGHQPVGIARNALQRLTQHLVHFAVTLGGLEETNAPVVAVAHQSRYPALPQLALRSPGEGTGAQREPRYLDAGFPQRHPIRSRSARRPQGQPSDCRQYTSGKPGLQEIASGIVTHVSPSNWLYLTMSRGPDPEPAAPSVTISDDICLS